MDATGLTVGCQQLGYGTTVCRAYFGFRPYFQKAMQGQLGRYYALGTTSQERGLFCLPHPAQRAKPGAVVVKISLDIIDSYSWGDDDNVLSSPIRMEDLYYHPTGMEI
ncbi:MAG: hypothetical protein R3F37_01200 [Candidatus Competibacteraceae bacterium]